MREKFGFIINKFKPMRLSICQRICPEEDNVNEVTEAKLPAVVSLRIWALQKKFAKQCITNFSFLKFFSISLGFVSLLANLSSTRSTSTFNPVINENSLAPNTSSFLHNKKRTSFFFSI